MRSQSQNPYDRFVNSLPATHGAPGTGKTFFIDELAALKPEDIEKYSSENMKGFWKDIVPVVVTYNEPSEYLEMLDKENFIAGFTLRMLWR